VLGQGTVFSFTLPVFSLPSFLAPAFKKAGYRESPIRLVVTEVGSQTGWLADGVRAEQCPRIRDLLRGCLHSDLDVLLPKMALAGAVEQFFIIAGTDEIGAEAISKRIRERWNNSEQFQQAGLTLSTHYRSLEAINRDPNESMEHLLKKVACNIQELINEEMSSKQVKNGQ
jgi:hypothetical protein